MKTKKHLTSDPSEQKSGDIFCGLINTAAAVFAYRLTLGGGYVYTEHHTEILDLLQKLTKIIEPYESKEIDIWLFVQ